ncbi:E3 ubiquitin-protein ligase SHPRH isoform X2 [Hetaerina americana]|uniref:E3 ubiquitin-protein ligase SHPRH isoform X2 n=1 Tax=Hetaerina americana TaxID=62018 RepID=UPI003A7F18CE
MPRVKLTAPQRLSDERREEINRSAEEKPQGVLSFLNDQLSKLTGTTKKPKPVKKSKELTQSKEIEDENLKGILSDCKFFLTLHKDVPLKDGELPFHIGNVEFKAFVDNEYLSPPDCDECWLYLSKIPGRSMLYFEWKADDPSLSSDEDNIVKYYLIEGLMDYPLYSGLHQSKEFSLILGNSKPDTEEGIIHFTVKVFLRINTKEKNLDKHERPVNKTIQKLAGRFFNIYPPEEPPPSKREKGGLRKDIEDLYDAVKLSHLDAMKIEIEEAVFHESLLPVLRPYQIAAVNWMLRREKQDEVSMDMNAIDPLYVKVETFDGKDLYYNPFNGSFDWEFPKRKPIPTGGVLADEMGLGKTVEVLACILSNPRKDLPVIEALESIVIEESDEPEHKNIDADENDTKIANGLADEENGITEERIPATEEEAETKVTSVDAEENVSTNIKVEEDEMIDTTDSKETADCEFSCKIEDAPEEKKSKPKMRKIVNRKVMKAKNHKNKKKKIKGSDVPENCDEKKPKRKSNVKAADKSKKPKKNESTNMALLNELYESAMAEYNVTKFLYDPSGAMKRREFFLTKVSKKSLFECTCGMNEVEAGGIGNNAHLSFELQQVQCNSCDMWQHARCVGYDLSDPFRGEYYCPLCWQEKDLVTSGATLIVSPFSIAFQWMDEIQRHIEKEDLKVLYYKREQDNGFIQPRVLARNDIVIVSYETLTKELDYLDIPHCNSDDGRRLRYAKRFMAIPSPITRVQWWRICLDEAQMVEMTSTKTAEMALRLSAVHRWCITGTPIQRSLNDLYGLVLFLDYFPYCVQLYWNSLLYHPYLLGERKPFYEALCNVMWRSCKKDVLDQIRIPPQREKIYWLKFCPTELHFYRKQHIHCSRSALAALAPFKDNIKLDSLDRKSLSKILNPLLSLRQACCHPQAVKLNKIGQPSAPKTNEWSMEHLLTSLVQKAKVEAEEALRICVAALNGLAGVHIISGEWSLAEDKYRSILKLADEYKDHLKVDTLQKIHTLHNLAEIVDNGMSATSIPLREEAQELQTKYLNKCSKKVAYANNEVAPFTKAVETILNGPTFQTKKPWWVQVLECCTNANLGSELVRKVKNDITDYMSTAGKGKVFSKFNHISDERGLRYVLSVRIEELFEKRDSILSEMEELMRIEHDPADASRLVMIAVDCHLRQSSCSAAIVSVGAKRKSQSDPSSSVNKEGNKRKSLTKKKNSTKCDLCDANANLEQYEAYLFKVLKQRVEGEAVLLGESNHMKNNIEEDDAQAVKVFGQLSRGNWADGEIERMLKVILGFAKSRKLDRELIEHGNNQIKLMEALKKEYKYLRILWRQLNDQVSAIDELDMAKLRLGLKESKEICEVKKKKNTMKGLSNKPEAKVESIHLLGQHELEPYAARLSVELAGGSCDLRKRMGQLFYLQNLEKANSGRHGGVNPDPCPICHKVLGEKWSVLHCGHCYCTECIKVVITQYCSRGGTIKCAVCREATHQSEVSYVDTSGGPPGEMCEEDKGDKCDNDEEEDSKKTVRKLYEVKGSHSTKVEAVVRTLLSLVDQDPEVKALVFSSFTNILEIIGKALFQNDIKFSHIKTSSQFQKSIDLFKDQDRDVTVLLLPVNSGSKGLNLIEATHVLLVEPILNAANELQAIGRIHRIGQTRSTVVHRFLVRDTIEERMHSVFHGGHHRLVNDDSSTAPEVTIGDLRLIFESVESKQDNSPPSSIYHSTANLSDEVEFME